MDDLKILQEEKISSKSTSDMIIEKIIPIIWSLLMASGVGYLLYTNIWVHLDEIIRIIIGFLGSIFIMVSWIKFWNKLKYFWEVVSSIWVLLFYWTLIYASRSSIEVNAIFPEISALFVGFIFTTIVSYIAKARNSSIIIMIALLGSYLLPFVIGQNNSWQHSISFNSFLIYFTAINGTLFFLSKEFNMKNIDIINRLWIILATSSLYFLSYYQTSPSNTFLWWDIFSAILFLMIALFWIGSLLITYKEKENKSSWYIALWYILTIFWYLININFLSLSDSIKWIFFICITLACFVWWHTLWEQKEKSEHIALYIWGIISAIFAFNMFVEEVNQFISIIISYSSLIFAFLYTQWHAKKERLISYFWLSFFGFMYAILNLWDTKIFSDTLLFILATIPTLAGIFITQKDDDTTKQLAKIYSIFWGIVILWSLFNYFFYNIDMTLVLFYILPIGLLSYIHLNSTLKIETKTIILRVTLVWFVLWFLGTFFTLLGNLYPSPNYTSLFTFFENPMMYYGLLWSIISYLWIYLSHKLDESEVYYHPTFLAAILFYSTIALFGAQIIIALWNDLGFWERSWGLRAVFITIYWIALGIFAIFEWVKKWIDYDSEKKIWIVLIFITLAKIIFYDMTTMEMDNKIIVLIIIWWMLLTLSYFIQKNGWLKTQNTLSKKPQKKKIINQKIENINVDEIQAILFSQNDGKTFTIKSKNLFKIAILIQNKKEKTQFEAWELQEIYDYILENYSSTLSKEDFKKLNWILKTFVDIGGEFTFKKI